MLAPFGARAGTGWGWWGYAKRQELHVLKFSKSLFSMCFDFLKFFLGGAGPGVQIAYHDNGGWRWILIGNRNRGGMGMEGGKMWKIKSEMRRILISNVTFIPSTGYPQ